MVTAQPKVKLAASCRLITAHVRMTTSSIRHTPTVGTPRNRKVMRGIGWLAKSPTSRMTSPGTNSSSP